MKSIAASNIKTSNYAGKFASFQLFIQPTTILSLKAIISHIPLYQLKSVFAESSSPLDSLPPRWSPEKRTPFPFLYSRQTCPWTIIAKKLCIMTEYFKSYKKISSTPISSYMNFEYI